VNALLQTSSISLKNVSYTDKVSGLTGLVEQVKRREGGTATGAAVVAAAPDASGAVDLSGAIAASDTPFRALYFLIRYNTAAEDISIPELQNDWRNFADAVKAITLSQFLTSLHDATPFTPLDDLSRLYTMIGIQRATCRKPNSDKFIGQFAPFLQRILGELEKDKKGKVAALATTLVPTPAATPQELIAYADALLQNPAAPPPPSFPKTTLPAYPLLVQYVNWLLLTQLKHE
jgi:hypothetical protein